MAYTADELAILASNKLTQRGAAFSGVSLPQLRLMVVQIGEPLARLVLKSDSLRKHLEQQFVTDALDGAGEVDITNLATGGNRLLLDGVKYWTVTHPDDLVYPLQYCDDVAALLRPSMTDTFLRTFALDGHILKTKNITDAAALAGPLAISGVAIPDIPSELPEALVELAVDLVCSQVQPNVEASTKTT